MNKQLSSTLIYYFNFNKKNLGILTETLIAIRLKIRDSRDVPFNPPPPSSDSNLEELLNDRRPIPSSMQFHDLLHQLVLP